MIPVKGYSTFDPLKHCVVGRAHAPEVVSDDLKLVMEQTEEDFQTLINILTDMGVQCYRPNATDKNSRPPISPRDYFIALGENLFVGKVIGGYTDILKNIDRKAIKWYLKNDISSGNMIRCGSHIHWDISKEVTSGAEQQILAWLEQNGYKVTITRYGWHMDGVYSILKPGVIVATRDLPELETIYKGWEICYLDQGKIKEPIQHKWGGNYQESTYDVNILSVDQAHCIVTKPNPKLFKYLEKNKIEPVLCEFRNLEFWDNGLHCFTQDLYREGQMEDYLQS